MDNIVEQSIHVAANESFDDPVDDDIDADEEINEVLEDELEEMDKSGSVEEDDEDNEQEDEEQEDEEVMQFKSTSKSLPTGGPSSKGKGTVNPKSSSANATKFTQRKSDNPSEGKESPGKKLLRMQLSSQILQKLLKEGKMEKLPTGSFRISADALKELKKNSPATKESKEQRSSSGPSKSKGTEKKRKYSSAEDFSDEEFGVEESEPVKACSKSIMPQKKKIAVSKKQMQSSYVKLNAKFLKEHIEKPTSAISKLDEISSDSKITVGQQRTAPKKFYKSHDYVSDFNTSEDEDDSLVKDLKDSLAELAPRKPGRLSKPVSLLFEQLHKGIFGTISDSSEGEEDIDISNEESIKRLATTDKDFESTLGDIPNDFWMVGHIGNDGKTKMCIRSTGKQKTWQGHNYPVYSIDTGVGSKTTVTPLMVTSLRSGEMSMKEGSAAKLDSPEADLVEQLLQKNVSLRKYKEQVRVLRRRYLQLARILATRPQLQTIGDLVASASRFLTQDQMLFFTMQLKGGCDATQGARFSTREKLLALGLYQQHPDTYKWLHRLYHLPSAPVLERWLDTVARGNPARVKQLMYYVYTRYCFRPRDDMVAQTFASY